MEMAFSLQERGFFTELEDIGNAPNLRVAM